MYFKILKLGLNDILNISTYTKIIEKQNKKFKSKICKYVRCLADLEDEECKRLHDKYNFQIRK